MMFLRRSLLMMMLATLAACATPSGNSSSIPVEYKGSKSRPESSVPAAIQTSMPAESFAPASVELPNAITSTELAPLTPVATTAPVTLAKLAPLHTLTVASIPSFSSTSPAKTNIPENKNELSDLVSHIASPAASAAASPFSAAFIWPVSGSVMRDFDARSEDGSHHDGLTLGAPSGAPVKASDGGIVAKVAHNMQGLGNVVIVQHPDSWLTIYAHLDALLVDKGDAVMRGQAIGTVGKSGGVPVPQLYFQMRQYGQPVNPHTYLGS